MASTTAESADHQNVVAEEPTNEVVYLTEEADGRPTGRKKYVPLTVQVLFLGGVPIMCVSFAVAGHFRIPFTIGAVLGVQLLYLRFRIKRFTGPLIDDEEMRGRISPPLLELCAAAKLDVPQVRVKRTTYPAGMGRINGRPTLWISPDFLGVVDDAELRAIISHEISHLRHDVRTPKKGSAWTLLFPLGWLAFVFSTGRHDVNWTYVALFFAFFMPAGQIVAWCAGFTRRKRETRADIEGAEAINDADAMIRGLRNVYRLGPDMRRRIYGPKPLRWIFLPYSLPPKIHPPLEKRVADLQALSLSDASAVTRTLDLQIAKSAVLRKGIRFAVSVAVVILIVVWQYRGSSPSISPRVESPGGAHYMPLSDLGLSSALLEFAPLSHNQRHDNFITAYRAISVALTADSEFPGNGLTVTVAEGNTRHSLIDNVNALSNRDWRPVYIVVFSGPQLANQGLPGNEEDVVIVNAYQGTVLDTFINEGTP